MLLIEFCGKRVIREESSVMRLSSEVMTCGFDRWEETMQHMMLITNNYGREKSVSNGSVAGGCMHG